MNLRDFPWTPFGYLSPRAVKLRFKRLHCINVATGRLAVRVTFGDRSHDL